MRILHITPDLNFALRFVVPVAEIQVGYGHEVCVITHNNEYEGSAAVGTSLYPTGVRFIMLNSKFRRIRDLTSVTKLVRTLRDLASDLTVCHTSVDSIVPIWLARVFTRSRIIYFNHGASYLGYRGLRRNLMKLIERFNIWGSHGCFTITSAMVSALEPLAGRAKTVKCIMPGSACGIPIHFRNFEKLEDARKGIRTRFGVSEDERLLLFVGRPVRRKGFFDLLEAWRGVGGDGKKRLIIVGPEKQEVSQLAAIDDPSISVVGYQEDLMPLYLQADAVCVPSHHEGLGYVYLEAASFGCLPICADVPGPTDFIEDEMTGFVCEAGNPQSIRTSIFRSFDDELARNRIKRAALEKVQTYDQEVVAENIALELENCL